MKPATLLASFALVALPTVAAAKQPIFAAECSGGVNRGGYNIDTDTHGMLWVNGHRVHVTGKSPNYFEGAFHGVVFAYGITDGNLTVSQVGPGQYYAVCDVVAQ